MRVVYYTGLPGTHLLSTVDKFQDDILYTYDVYDEQDLDDLIGDRGDPAAVVNDSFTFIEHTRPFPVYCVNLWLENQVAKFQDLPLITDPVTEYAVNFVINKKQINRYLAIKLVEYFDLSMDYTWSGIGRTFDMSQIVNSWQTIPMDDIPADARTALLSPIGIPAKWIKHTFDRENSYAVINYGGNVWTWLNGIDKVVAGSAVSIITESVREQRAMHFSEKTLYSVLGLTFPLWVGGYRQADEWRACGFDVFDDVIDHSYQYRETLVERCWWALKSNQALLQDLKLLKDLRKKHMARLIDNRARILSDHLRIHNNQVIATWPVEIQQSISPILSAFR